MAVTVSTQSRKGSYNANTVKEMQLQCEHCQGKAVTVATWSTEGSYSVNAVKETHKKHTFVVIKDGHYDLSY
jgi:hypothetical protein